MKHLWRNAWLLLAAILLLLTVALAADSAEPEEIRFLTQEEKIEITQTDAPDQPKLTTLPPGTLVWPHVPGANQYQLGLYSNGASFFWPLSLDNSFYLIDYLPSESAEITVTVQAIDEENADIENGYYEITFSYVPPTERLAVPNVKVTGSVLSVEPVEHAKYYEVKFQVDGSPEKSCGYQTSEALISQISVPAWFVEEYPDADFVVHVRAVSPNPLQYLDSEWSAFLEIDRPEKLPEVTGARMITTAETVTVRYYDGRQVTRTLYPGSLTWDLIEGADYIIQYFRETESGEGELIAKHYTQNAFYLVEDLDITLGKGTYYATITTEPRSEGYLSSDPVVTNTWILAETPQPLPVPTLTVNGSQATVSGNMENVARFDLQILERESQEVLSTIPMEISYSTCVISENLVEEYPDTEFSVRVQAIAKDLTKNTNSAWSESMPIDTPERLPSPANVRIITKKTTTEASLGNGQTYEKTLYPGAIEWDAVEDAEHYSVRILRDGKSYEFYGVYNTYLDRFWGDGDILPGGTYTVEVTAECLDGRYLDSLPGVSNAWEYVQPDTKLQTPSNLRWDGSVATVDPVTSADGYSFRLYYRPNADSPWENLTEYFYPTSSSAQYDFGGRVSSYGNGQYVFQVSAYCDDVTAYVSSDWSDFSEVWTVSYPQLSMPTNFRIVEEVTTVTYQLDGEMYSETVRPGSLVWDQVEGARMYYVHGMREDQRTDFFSDTYAPCCDPNGIEGLYAGTYRVTVKANGVYGESADSPEAVIESYVVNIQEEQLSDPTVQQNGKELSLFNAETEEVFGYELRFYKGSDRGTAVWTSGGHEVLRSNCVAIPGDIWEMLDGEENIYVSVRALALDPREMRDSDWSQMVWLTAPGSVKETISQVEQIVMALPETAGLAAVQNELEKIDSDRLLTALEEKPAEMAAQIAQLEQRVGVKVIVDGEAQVVGLGLSAKNANTPVTLTITRTAHDGLQLLDAPEISSANFQSATDVTFKAENVKDELVIPVQISLPVSTEDPDQLRLYQGEDLEEVPFILAMENGQTFVKFAVSDLDQTYVLAEANPLGEVTVDDNGTVTVTANAPDGTTLYAASYDESGKMLDVATASVTADETSYTLSLAPGAAVRVFLLDQNQTPLCQAKTLS